MNDLITDIAQCLTRHGYSNEFELAGIMVTELNEFLASKESVDSILKEMEK